MASQTTPPNTIVPILRNIQASYLKRSHALTDRFRGFPPASNLSSSLPLALNFASRREKASLPGFSNLEDSVDFNDPPRPTAPERMADVPDGSNGFRSPEPSPQALLGL